MSTKVQRNHITILNIYKYITKYLNIICIIFEMCIIIHTNFTNHNTVLLMYVMLKMLYEIAFMAFSVIIKIYIDKSLRVTSTT